MGEADGRAAMLAALHGELRAFHAEAAMFSQVVAERLGVGPTDLQVLSTLGAAGPLPAGRLAELTGLATATMTGVVDRLERAGFVRRERDAADRRRVIVTPQPQVRQVVSPLFGPVQQDTVALCERYDDHELGVILDFVVACRPIMTEHTAALRTPPASGPD